ncbi:MAG: amidohydrolase family protein, partial [Gammaproteobacteria bacterium]|nr:amidohydrolase family protein [Gammaproteobacteria bacterium]
MAHDLVIRNGQIVDGTGAEPRPGDLAIDDGIISALGKVENRGKHEIDAEGLAVTPGFIDLHTHLDAQIGWDPSMTPISWHGVTTALMGNCGVTFAPCRPDDNELLAGMMETVEDIPKNAILTGLPWDWEDYGGYLDAIERLQPALNVAGLVGHCAVRFYVMGERAVEEQATPEERRQMADVVAHSMDRGAVGFSTNRFEPHVLPDGRSVPGTFAEPEELVQIAGEVGPRNGLLQAVGANFHVLKTLAQTPGSRLLYSSSAEAHQGSGKARAETVAALCEYGDVTAIAHVRGSGVLFGLQSVLPVQGGAWDALRGRDFAGRLESMRDAATRATLVEEARQAKLRFSLADAFYLGDGETPEYTAPADENLEARAAAAGEHWAETFLRLSLETDGRALFNLRVFSPNLKELGDMILSPNVFPSLGDAGAHVSQIMDGGWSTFIL